MTVSVLESTSTPSLLQLVRVAVIVRFEARCCFDAQNRIVPAETQGSADLSGRQDAEMRDGQKGDWVMVTFETITRCEREKSTACGRPCGRLHQCAGVGLAQGPCPLIAAHQKSPCPAIVPLLPVMCTSVTFQPPRIGS